MIYTGPVDEYFGFRFGRLPYRWLDFEHVTLDQEWSQPVAVVNYPQTEAYTRITEYKYLTGQKHPLTSLTYEYPSANGDPYYPIPMPENALYKRYETLARATPDVWFVGRLATYRYYNMDQVVGQALATFQRIDAALPRRGEAHSDVLRAGLTLSDSVARAREVMAELRFPALNRRRTRTSEARTWSRFDTAGLRSIE